MFRNYFKTAIRSLLKNKATTIINILGLSIGICAALIIFLIVKHENSFDKWEPDNDRIFRIYTQYSPTNTNDGISMMAPKDIERKMPEFEVTAHFIKDRMNDAIMEIPNSTVQPQKILVAPSGTIFADANYFKIFPTKWLQGNAGSLDGFNNIVLSASIAEKYFPKTSFQDIIGRTIIFNDSITTTVKGIVADYNASTDFNYNVFISLKTLTESKLNEKLVGTPNWTNVNAVSQFVVKLKPGQNVATVNKHLKALYAANITPDTPDEFIEYGKLQPLSDIHLNTYINGDGARKNQRNIIFLAIVIILLASINFINLTTAQSSLRAKEIGVRKTFGSNKLQIIFQFLSETFLLMLFSSLLACLLYPLMFHLFKGFIPTSMEMTAILQPLTAFYLLGLVIVLTILAGLYPAMIMSGYQPIQALKGKLIRSGKSEKVWLRQSLIVFQFVIAQVFLIIVFVVGKQIHYVLNKDMGFK